MAHMSMEAQLSTRGTPPWALLDLCKHMWHLLSWHQRPNKAQS